MLDAWKRIIQQIMIPHFGRFYCEHLGAHIKILTEHAINVNLHCTAFTVWWMLRKEELKFIQILCKLNDASSNTH